MEKALLSSDDIHECLADDASQGAPRAGHASRSVVSPKRTLSAASGVPRALATLGARTPLEASSHVLVTFRGVAVDERLVRYAQERAAELGLARTGGLHVLLSKSTDEEECIATVRARIGARRHERCACAGDSMLAMRTAFDALSPECPRMRPRR